MSLTSLRAKARNNQLEVEHILAAAAKRVPGLRDELRRLSAELEWSDTPYPAVGEHVVPFARWAAVAGAYAEDGVAGLAALTGDRTNWSYILGLLEELRSLEAVEALPALFPDVLRDPLSDPETAFRMADAFNLLLSFKKAPVISDGQAGAIRQFLLALLPAAHTNPERCGVLCALRGVGDRATLDIVAAAPDMPAPYQDVKASVTRTIRKRIGK